MADDAHRAIKLALQAFGVEVVIEQHHIDTFTLKRVAALVDHHSVTVLQEAAH
ncbi:hypothetical protein D9M70_553220 [compost metagenome]